MINRYQKMRLIISKKLLKIHVLKMSNIKWLRIFL